MISLIKFFIYGLLWLFIFSYQVNSKEKLFDVAHRNIVDTKFVQDVKNSLVAGAHKVGSLFSNTTK